ncbi:MoaD/ThiS family protein [Nakamurella sp. YIM 132084]|uniref:MoaD/ThiS family protein n=1 Tax=Nakamurella leprariae TaxID=2803911 RepID=A0A938Y5H7_9ACTN|nr:MoaD/ThiS family protein [Nakamurella leprariae]
MTAAAPVTVTVRYFAAARAATRLDQETLTLDAPATVQHAAAVAVQRHGRALASVLTRCSFLLDEVAVHGLDQPVSDGAVIDVLPPFAGG